MFNVSFFFSFLLGLPAAYAAAYGRGYPGYASFGLPYPAGKLKVYYSLSLSCRFRSIL